MPTDYGPIIVEELPSGYLRAQGRGPCEWAQWPGWEPEPRESDFFPEASIAFRCALRAQIRGDFDVYD